jgi:hypothetical protein
VLLDDDSSPTYAYSVPESPLTWHSETGHRKALEALGLKNVHTETVIMLLAAPFPDGVVDYAFRGGNPVMERMVSDWQAHGGDVAELESEYAKVIREDFAEAVTADAVLGWGTK